VLFARRADSLPDNGGLWEFPGGAVNDGESSLAALERELIEELGVVPTAPPVLLRSGNDGSDQGEWFTETYLVAAISGEPRILEPEKCAELGFFRMDSPPLPLLRAARLDLEALMVRGDWPET
jgi:8-oxo-dGTP diphosphatase